MAETRTAGSIRYEEHGRGRPLILLHGFGADRRLMTGCMEPLFTGRKTGGALKNWRRLYPDLPGMGESPAADSVKNSSDVVEEILVFLGKVLDPHEHFVIGGESYGGYLAAEIARRMPERVGGLLLICPPLHPLMEDRDLPPPSIVHRENFDLPGDASPKEKSEFRRSPVQTRKTWKRYEEDVLSGSRIADRPFLRRLRPHGYPLADDPYRPEAPFKKPALFLHGRQDHIVGYRDAFKILEFFPRASYVVLDRAGHNLQIDQPALFEALVREWLFRVAETAGN